MICIVCNLWRRERSSWYLNRNLSRIGKVILDKKARQEVLLIIK